MPKYLWQVSYTSEGLQGLIKEGGSSRRNLIENIVKSMGGKMESFYFAMGDHDVYVTVDMPDDVTAIALGLVAEAQGGARVSTIQLLTPEQLDKAVKISIDYRKPGG